VIATQGVIGAMTISAADEPDHSNHHCVRDGKRASRMALLSPGMLGTLGVIVVASICTR
jgi:hypothetical protein